MKNVFQHFAELDSTNAEAMRRAVAGERGPLWITASRQTAGRGRAGRAWESEDGNLYASLLVSLPAPASKAYQLSLVAGVLVHDALCAALPPAAHAAMRLKWPNDILIGGAKAGGILIESTVIAREGDGQPGPADGMRLAAIIGIGVNIATYPQGLDRPVTSLAAHGATPEPAALLARIAYAADRWLAVWRGGEDFAAIRKAWLMRAHPIGERMSIDTGTERVTGTFEGLDADGGLLIDAGAGIRRFAFGDVSLAV
ncbi:biotin--[acetyl-CoA-carboxylase] ligase [Hyphomicrobium sp.]|uniref:biotin--[acetyl-CoA-carboxylase] ligase n=1 Tax=Hyphomicrobium sp. TaxID=82 RepID=UPI003F705603